MTSLLLPLSQVFNLIRPLPLLEDLNLAGTVDCRSIDLIRVYGTLELLLYLEMKNTARRLLDPPNGLHFRKLDLAWRDEEDIRWVVMLVAACSDTFERLEVTDNPEGEAYSTSLLDQ